MHFILHFSKELKTKEIEDYPELSTRGNTESERADINSTNYNEDCDIKNKNKESKASDKKENLMENALNTLLKDECLIEICESLVKNIYDLNNKAYNENLDLDTLIKDAESLL